MLPDVAAQRTANAIYGLALARNMFHLSLDIEACAELFPEPEITDETLEALE